MAGQVRMEELLAKAVTVDVRKSDAADTFRRQTFGRGRIVAGATQVFRQCYNVSTCSMCQQNGPSWSESSSSDGVEAEL